MQKPTSRRSFLKHTTLGAAALGVTATAGADDKPKIQGFEESPTDPNASQAWKPYSDRKLRVGIVGYGVCRFGAAFSFQDHPHVEIVAVSDLFPDRCAKLAQVCRCEKNLSLAGRIGQRRQYRGGILCHGCAKSCTALLGGTTSWEARSLCGSGDSRFAGRC